MTAQSEPGETSAGAFSTIAAMLARLEPGVTSCLGRLDLMLADTRIWRTAIVAVIALQLTLIFRHSAWLDEWQALQIAWQSPTLSDLMINLRYEGHPPLWYLILRGLGSVLPNPRDALPVAAALIAVPVQLTILCAAPFRRGDRLMFALSEFVLFDFMTVSRSLTLGVALTIFAVAVWRQRTLPWLLIALLPQCDFHFGVISVILAVLRWRAGRMAWPLALLWVASSLFAAWSVRPMPDIVPAMLPKGTFGETANWFANMAVLGLPLQWHGWLPRWNNPPPIVLGGIGLVGFLAMAYGELRNERDYAIAFGGYLLLTLVLSLLVYPFAVRHLMMLALLLVLFVWLRCTTDAGSSLGLGPGLWMRAWLLVATVCGLATAVIALVIPFDTSDRVVQKIDELGLRDKTWVNAPRYMRQGVAAIGGISFERLDQHCSEDFVRWNDWAEKHIRDYADLYRQLALKRDQDGRYYLLTGIDIAPVPGLVRQIASVDAGYDGQSFAIYVIGENRRDARPHGINCNGPTRPFPHI